MTDLVSIIGFYGILAAAIFTPIFIIVKAIESYKLVNRDRNVYVFKSVIALGVWLVLSLGMLFLLFVQVYASAHRDRNATSNWTGEVVFISLTLAYGLIGLVLVRWMTRRE